MAILNKPIYIGCTILDLAKLKLYQSYYELINIAWPNNILHYTDTDSLYISIKSEDTESQTKFDIYEDMENLKINSKPLKDYLDLSNYLTFPHQDIRNIIKHNNLEKVPGYLKDENQGEQIEKGTFIKSKMYSIYKNNESINKCKSAKKYIVKKMSHEEFQQEKIYKDQISLQQKNGQMVKIQTEKQVGTRFDDKIGLVTDNIVCVYGAFEVERERIKKELINEGKTKKEINSLFKILEQWDKKINERDSIIKELQPK